MDQDDQQNVPMSEETEEPKEDEAVEVGDEPEDDDAM